MCLSIPAQIIELLAGDNARVGIGGVEKTVSVSLLDGPRVGDYVLVHAGYALSLIDAEEAKKTLELFGQLFGAESGLTFKSAE